MPKSRVRTKKVYTAPTDLRPQQQSAAAARKRPSPTWVPITALVLIVAGIAWLVTFYLSSGLYPIGTWGYWNLAVGFGALVASLLVLSRWH